MKNYENFINEELDSNIANQIFKDMVKDFEENGKDVRKAMMMDCKMHYVFGKYHQINNSPMTGNKKVGSKDISISYWKPEHLFTTGKGIIEIEEKIKNPKYDPDFSYEKGGKYLKDSELKNKCRIYDEKNENLEIPYKQAKRIIDYFIQEWDKKYPQLKLSKYKNEHHVNEIESGEDVHLGSVDLHDKKNNEIIYFYSDIKDKDKLEKYIKNHICVQGKSRENYPVTFFTKEGETEEDAIRFMKNTPKERIERINLERIREYSK